MDHKELLGFVEGLCCVTQVKFSVNQLIISLQQKCVAATESDQLDSILHTHQYVHCVDDLFNNFRVFRNLETD